MKSRENEMNEFLYDSVWRVGASLNLWSPEYVLTQDSLSRIKTLGTWKIDKVLPPKVRLRGMVRFPFSLCGDGHSVCRNYLLSFFYPESLQLKDLLSYGDCSTDLTKPNSFAQQCAITPSPCSTVYNKPDLLRGCNFPIVEPNRQISALLCPCVCLFSHSLTNPVWPIPGAIQGSSSREHGQIATLVYLKYVHLFPPN